MTRDADVLGVVRLAQAQALLHLEARLLDERRLEEWLELFTADAQYRLPITGLGDPREPSIVDESRAGMEERVFRLTKTLAHWQNPPSRTQHDVTNVEVHELGDGLLEVRCHQTVHEMRGGDAFHVGLGKPRVLAARCRYVVVQGPPWRIREKTCWLLDRENPLDNRPSSSSDDLLRSARGPAATHRGPERVRPRRGGLRAAR